MKGIPYDKPLCFTSHMSQQQFHRFMMKNSELRMERDKHGNITIHPGLSLYDSFLEGKATSILSNWAKDEKIGLSLGSSMHYVLPDGSEVKADGSWLSVEKVNQLTEKEIRRITPIIPDFVLETRSVSDSIEKLKIKMSEVWIANGVRLAWLLDPMKEQAWIYREDGSVEEIQGFDQQVLSGENVLPGFELNLKVLKSRPFKPMS